MISESNFEVTEPFCKLTFSFSIPYSISNRTIIGEALGTLGTRDSKDSRNDWNVRRGQSLKWYRSKFSKRFWFAEKSIVLVEIHCIIIIKAGVCRELNRFKRFMQVLCQRYILKSGWFALVMSVCNWFCFEKWIRSDPTAMCAFSPSWCRYMRIIICVVVRCTSRLFDRTRQNYSENSILFIFIMTFSSYCWFLCQKARKVKQNITYVSTVTIRHFLSWTFAGRHLNLYSSDGNYIIGSTY